MLGYKHLAWVAGVLIEMFKFSDTAQISQLNFYQFSFLSPLRNCHLITMPISIHGTKL